MKKKKKRIEDEVVGVSTSLAQGGRHRPLVLPVPTLVFEKVGNLSTPTTTKVTIAATETSRASMTRKTPKPKGFSSILQLCTLLIMH